MSTNEFALENIITGTNGLTGKESIYLDFEITNEYN